MTKEDKIAFVEDALRYMVQLLPPEDYGENPECYVIYTTLESYQKDLTNPYVDYWVKCSDKLPEENVKVLCYHDSGNYFICYRTRDCITDKPKWFDGAQPHFWKHLPKPPEL